MTILQLCEWLEATAIATIVRESQYGFAIVVALHILGLTLSVGTLVWFDLRLLGVSMVRVPASTLYRRLSPLLVSGFFLMFITGSILFMGFATAAYGNLYFRIKAAAILLAGINAVLFHFMTERTIDRWDEAPRPPLAARLAGLTSIAAWAVVIVAGRMMSYTMF
jgi:hypothetical protein